MIPNIVYEDANLANLFSAKYAWYTLEDETIHLVKGIKPKWLAFLHEFGHHLISYFPSIVHYHIALDYEYDTLWDWFRLSDSLDVSDVEIRGMGKVSSGEAGACKLRSSNRTVITDE